MKIKKISTYRPHFIAFLDILGFKELVKSHGFNEIRDVFSHIGIDEKNISLSMSRAADEEDDLLKNYNCALKLCKIRIMSDSIVVAAPSRYVESLAVVLDVCNNIQENLYECNEPVFLRGAVAEGEVYFSDEVMFGQGLIDAYLAQENISVYPRIIVSEEVLAKGKASVDEFGAYGYGGLSVDSDGYHYINTMGNWLLLANCGISIRDTYKYKKLKRYIEKTLSGYPDNRVREKYLWLQAELERAADTSEKTRVLYERSVQ